MPTLAELKYMLQHGRVYFPATSHMGVDDHVVVSCDVCSDAPLLVSIGLDGVNWDICPTCVGRLAQVLANQPVDAVAVSAYVADSKTQDNADPLSVGASSSGVPAPALAPAPTPAILPLPAFVSGFGPPALFGASSKPVGGTLAPSASLLPCASTLTPAPVPPSSEPGPVRQPACSFGLNHNPFQSGFGCDPFKKDDTSAGAVAWPWKRGVFPSFAGFGTGQGVASSFRQGLFFGNDSDVYIGSKKPVCMAAATAGPGPGPGSGSSSSSVPQPQGSDRPYVFG
jgi:hypothetical protein